MNPRVSARPLSWAAASSPANIALVKYMGKEDPTQNLPANPSLSLTLERARTWVEVNEEELVSGVIAVEPVEVAVIFEASRPGSLPTSLSRATLGLPEYFVPKLDARSQDRFLKHFQRCMARIPAMFAEAKIPFRDPAEFRKRRIVIRSANSFPTGAGVASSASSFSALTLASASFFARDHLAWSKAYAADANLKRALAALSREGSGSSCRSFEGPWVFWEGARTEAVASPLSDLTHFLLVVDEAQKEVSSSEAHRRITSSPQWQGRAERARTRASEGVSALGRGDFQRLVQLAWDDFMEMHSLFHTCSEPFSYWSEQSKLILEFFTKLRTGSEALPLVTMDAGANVHVVVPTSEASSWKARLEAEFQPQGIKLLVDGPGLGARLEGFSK